MRVRSRIYRRPESPRLWAEWTDPTGRIRRESTGSTDYEAARAFLAARELDRARAALGVRPIEPRSISAASREYLNEHVAPIWSKKWHQTVEGFLRLRILPALGADTPMTGVSEGHAARFRAAQVGRVVARILDDGSETKLERKPTSPATVNRIVWAMASFWTWAIRRGYAVTNPWAGFDNLAEDQDRVPAASPEEVAQLLASVSDRWRPAAEFAYLTGLRKGEIGRLAWRDVDLVRGEAWIVSTHSRGLTKGRKRRVVVLAKRTLLLLKTVPVRPDGLVFGPLGDARRSFKTAAKSAGWERAWWHLFRHLSASRLADLGAGAHDLQAWGGWSNLKVTEKYLRSRTARVRALLDGTPTAPARRVRRRKGSDQPQPAP